MLPGWTIRQWLYPPKPLLPGEPRPQPPCSGAPVLKPLSNPAAGALISLVISLLRAEEALQRAAEPSLAGPSLHPADEDG